MISLVCFQSEDRAEGGEEETFMMEQLVSFLAEVGFPITVTFYLLHRIEGKLNQLIDSIHTLPEKMQES